MWFILVAVVFLVPYRGDAWQPISIPPTAYWDGDDGSWSTFQLQIGTPPQAVRLLPATSGVGIWPVVPEGCTSSDPVTCGVDRGFTFLTNASSTWDFTGLYTLFLVEETLLGRSGHGEYGKDIVGLGWPQPSLISIGGQAIAGIATKDFYIGSLGLSPYAVNTSTLNDPIPSLLTSLKAQKSIPSISWAYTAGASYLTPPLLGSLVLGGYDSERFIPNDLQLPFGQDISRELLLSLRSINWGSGKPLLRQAIPVFLDSLVPEMWLPVSACQLFELAFNLTWNTTLGLYVVSDAVHNQLLAESPTFVFTVGGFSGGPTVDITLPYAAFDLLMTKAPKFATPLRYFPLKQAANSTQYTLGRTFFQGAYVVYNHEKSIFTVSAAKTANSSLSQKLIAIPPADSKSSLSTGALVGIVVGVVIVALLVLLAAMLVYRRRRLTPSRRAAESVSYREVLSSSPTKLPPSPEAAELLGRSISEAHADSVVLEMDNRGPKPKIDSHNVYELPAGIVERK